jgi:lipoprotein NlpD
MPGIYHRVEKGQTLWRICKSYNVDLDGVVQLNRIADSTNIEVGQRIFIPGAKEQKFTSAVSSPNNDDDFIWPIKGRVISGFGQVSGDVVNKGINIQPSADLNVVAVRQGKVVFCSDNFGIFGRTLILEHSDGISTVYARNAEVFVKVGEFVNKGALLARAGSVGKDPRRFLHFEVRKGHTPQNPLFYLP